MNAFARFFVNIEILQVWNVKFSCDEMAELIKINFEENSIKSDASLTMDRLDILSFDVALNDEKTIKASESDDNGTTKTTSHETSASTNGDARTSLDVTTLASHDVDDFNVVLAATYLDDALQNRHIDCK